ncbi:MAG: disulfide bond formation protein B [Gammaproteobacteria bacterium]
MSKILNFAQSKLYWVMLLVLGFLSEAIALFYQYGLDYLPCVLCIHIRIWVMGFMLVAVAALVLHRYAYTSIISHLLTTGMMVGGLERAWYMLGIERGTVFGSCSMESGLPTWFQLDQWFPWMFKVWEACGYTPLLLFRISMAEALTVMFALMLVMSAVLATISIRDRILK